MGGALPIELLRHISSTRAFSLTDRRKTVGAAASGTFAARCPAIARPPHRARKHSRQGSNLQHAVLETAALPILSYGNTEAALGIEPAVSTHAPRSKLRSGGHIKQLRFTAGAVGWRTSCQESYTFARILRPFLGTGGCTCGLAGCLVHAPYGAIRRNRTASCLS